MPRWLTLARKILTLGPDPFVTTDEHEADVRDVLYAGRWSTPPIPDNRQAEHVLDLDPHDGEFACWAYMRFGGPWIDCLVKPSADADHLETLRRNVPPSGRLIESVGENSRYDVIHAGERAAEGLLHLARCKPQWFGAEWNREEDRRAIDAACTTAGLRLFKIEVRDVDVGRGLWLRSDAVWVDGQYRLIVRNAA